MSLRGENTQGNNLKEEIDGLASKGIVPKIMQDWVHNVRELGNDSAHPKPDQPTTSPQDAKDIVGFMDYLFEYLYTLPKRINEYREKKIHNKAIKCRSQEAVDWSWYACLLLWRYGTREIYGYI